MKRNRAGAQARASRGGFVPSGSGAWYLLSRWRFAASPDGWNCNLGRQDRHERGPPVQIVVVPTPILVGYLVPPNGHLGARKSRRLCVVG